MTSVTIYKRLRDRDSSQSDCCLGQIQKYDEVIREQQYVGESISTNLCNQHSDTIFTLLPSFHKKICNTPKALKTFISFLLECTGSETQSECIVSILGSQVHQFPSCIKNLNYTYETLFLSSEKEFKGLNLMNYLVSHLLNLLSHRQNSFSVNRMSRRKRKRKCLDVKTAESAKDTSDSNETIQQKEQNDSDQSKIIRFLWMVNYCCELLKHDLDGKINRGENVNQSIIFKLVFKGEEDFLYLDLPFLSKVFEIYKSESIKENRHFLARLLELCAEVCALVDGVADVCFSQLAAYTQSFVNEFLVQVFEEVPANEFAHSLIKTLDLHWLRYFAAHYLLEKVCSRKIAAGMRGVWKVLKRLFPVERSTTLNVLQTVDNNDKNGEGASQLISACRTDDVTALNEMIDSNVDLSVVDRHGRSILHIVAKYGSVNCAKLILKKTGKKKLKVRVDDKGMTPLSYAEKTNNVEIQTLLANYTGSSSKDQETKKSHSMTLKLLTIIVTGCAEMSESADALHYLKESTKLFDCLKTKGITSSELLMLSTVVSETKKKFERFQKLRETHSN